MVTMKKAKVFYVEDEVFLAKIVCETLQGRGYEVIFESDGAKAIQQFNSVNPDICILDIMLPSRDGFSIADEIRNKNEQVPIIFLTAKSNTSDVLNGFKLGANDYIRKPFSIEELIARIENILRSKTLGRVESNEVVIGAYVFNFKRQTLLNGLEARKLSHRENELLKLLYGHRDKIIERSEILTLLWGSDSFFNSRNLDVYITKLRNYLKQDSSIEIITIKGIGYRFIAN
ncbi:MAG: response regulator transcription factor [Flavisolibacter sp.]